MVPPTGLEPVTRDYRSLVITNLTTEAWWRTGESNPIISCARAESEPTQVPLLYAKGTTTETGILAFFNSFFI